MRHSIALATKVAGLSVLLAVLLTLALASVGNINRYNQAHRHDQHVKLQSSTTTPTTWWMRRPCPTEDSVNCVWDARRRGNHTGHTFYVRQVPGPRGIVCVFYVGKRYAKHHDYCS